MKISFTTLATPGVSGTDAIKLARQYGYDGIDLRVSAHKGEIEMPCDAGRVRELRAALDAEGVACASLMCYNKVAGADVTQEADEIKRHLELAERIGSLSIRIFMEKPADFADNPERVSLMAEALRVAADTSPILIQMQNHGGQLNAAECLRVVRETERDNVKLFYSPDHCLAMGEDIPAVTRGALGLMGHMYYADVIVSGGRFDGQMPGEGEVPWPEIFGILKSGGFDGWVSFKWEKMWHPELAGHEESLPRFVSYMKQYV